jgi:hypothetical protein
MKHFFLILSFILLTSCGESPLLNHRNEGAQLVTNTELSEGQGLRFPKTDYAFVISWVEGPRLGESRFLMKTWREDMGTINGPYQDLDRKLHVFLWMPSMGHGSAPVKIEKSGDGEYEVSSVQFIMGGKWEVKFQLKDGGQVFDEVIVPLSI